MDEIKKILGQISFSDLSSKHQQKVLGLVQEFQPSLCPKRRKSLTFLFDFYESAPSKRQARKIKWICESFTYGAQVSSTVTPSKRGITQKQEQEKTHVPNIFKQTGQAPRAPPNLSQSISLGKIGKETILYEINGLDNCLGNEEKMAKYFGAIEKYEKYVQDKAAVISRGITNAGVKAQETEKEYKKGGKSTRAIKDRTQDIFEAEYNIQIKNLLDILDKDFSSSSNVSALFCEPFQKKDETIQNAGPKKMGVLNNYNRALLAAAIFDEAVPGCSVLVSNDGSNFLVSFPYTEYMVDILSNIKMVKKPTTRYFNPIEGDKDTGKYILATTRSFSDSYQSPVDLCDAPDQVKSVNNFRIGSAIAEYAAKSGEKNKTELGKKAIDYLEECNSEFIYRIKADITLGKIYSNNPKKEQEAFNLFYSFANFRLT